MWFLTSESLFCTINLVNNYFLNELRYMIVNMRKELENIYIRIIYFKVYDDSIMK